MKLVAATNALTTNSAITLNATVDGGAGDWKGNGEMYPIALGWGVTLSAPGVFFTDPGGMAPEVFDVAVQSGESSPGSTVTIEGVSGPPASPVVVGTDSSGNVVADTTTILVESNETLNANGVIVWEASGNTGINLQTSATLDVDNKSAGGTLQLGGALPDGTANTNLMGTGLLCNGTVDDSNALASHSVIGQGETVSIDAEDGCSLTLTDLPMFGWGTAGGYTNAGQGCSANANPMDGTAIQANGNASVFLSTVNITCMSNYGVSSTNTNSETTTPTVTIGGGKTAIENCGLAGVYVTAGSVTVQAGSIDHNFIGVDIENDSFDTPSVTLNDGNMLNNTTVICNSNQETGGSNPGIDVFNNSTGNVAADYVNWDQWYDPNGGATGTTTDIFWCDSSNFSCTCEVLDSSMATACKNSGNDDLDLVMGGDGGAITGSQTSSNGMQASGACN
jgi:hypothetical protein